MPNNNSNSSNSSKRIIQIGSVGLLLSFLFSAKLRGTIVKNILFYISFIIYSIGSSVTKVRLWRNGRQLNNGKGYNLPPVVPATNLVHRFQINGPEQMHLTMRECHADHGSIFTVITPITPIILVSDPEAVQTVMTDKVFFPSRPDTLGFRTFIPLGLLGLPTNEMWQTHRRLLSKGFAEPAMKIHCSTIGTEMMVLLKLLVTHSKKVEAANINVEKMQKISIHAMASKNAVMDIVLSSFKKSNQAHDDPVNSTFRFGQTTIDIHEEITRLTFDIIGKIAFGVDFQTLIDRDSLSFKAGDILISEAALRSASPEFTWNFPLGRMPNFIWARDYARSLAKGTISAIAASTDPEERKRIASSKNPMIEGNMVQAMLSAAAEEENELNKKKKPSSSSSDSDDNAQSSSSSSSSNIAFTSSKMASHVAQLKNDKKDRLISDEEVIQEALTLLGAGHETTANTTSSALLLLSQHPEIQDWLREEVVNSLPMSKNLDEDGGVRFLPPTFAVWRKLERTQAVILEALRLFPTVPMFPRKTENDTKLMGYDIPKDSWVFVHQDGLNRNAELWGKDVESFRPQRFLVPGSPALSGFVHGIPLPADKMNSEDKAKYNWAFMPFGAGPRSCLGRRLAMMESVIILSSLIANFKFVLPKGISVETVPMRSDITMGHKFGLPLLIYSSKIMPSASVVIANKKVAQRKNTSENNFDAPSVTPSL